MASQAAWNADLYNDKHSFVWKLAQDLLPMLAPQPGERILDLGCGTGHLSSQIAESGASVAGIDSSADMIREARDKYPQVRFEVADARKIPLTEAFDAVFSNAALHWIREPQAVIAEVARLLKPGGRFVAEFGGKGNVLGLITAIERAFAVLRLPMPPNTNPWYFPSIAEYATLLESRGIEVRHAVLFDRPTPLEDGERGLEAFLRMFGSSFFAALPADKASAFIREVERAARPALFRDGTWTLDYRRLRILAVRS
jgi:trans-aconitate methyltransferase